MTRLFVPAGILAFLVGTLVADVVARVRVAGETWSEAFRSHVDWVGLAFVGELLLFAPFLAIAFVCRSLAKRGLPKIAVALFAIAIAALLYFYFEGFYAAQIALLTERWTASALSVGLLPFFVGVPIVSAVGLVALVARAVQAKRVRV